jgi:hypothetical protein
MGLDMYFFEVPAGKSPKKVRNEIQYFRKHADLHGWLVEKSGKKELNCEFMEITPEICKELQRYCTEPGKKHYSGFFWGESQDYQWEDTVEMLNRIEGILKEGNKVFYRAWY